MEVGANRLLPFYTHVISVFWNHASMAPFDCQKVSAIAVYLSLAIGDRDSIPWSNIIPQSQRRVSIPANPFQRRQRCVHILKPIPSRRSPHAP